MQYNVPKVATIQDLSGYGRCALTVAIPVLSAMGVQVCPIPTAVLSTHMGGFGKPAFCDLTPELDTIIDHWQQLGLQFDALYSGFLANEEQVHQVIRLFEVFKSEGTFTLVDPVMGDKGKLYSSYTPKMQQEMKKLVSVADIVTPNRTELYLLIDEPYTERVLMPEEVCDYARKVSELGPKCVILKGIALVSGEKINAGYDKVQDSFFMCPYEEIPAHYPGTGDAFASVVVGQLIKGYNLQQAVEKAATFVRGCVQCTEQAGTDPRAGVLLETQLGDLMMANCRGDV